MEKLFSLDFMKQLRLGRRQSSGVMHVYPIIGKNLSSDMAAFEDLKFLRTSDYGSMVFENKSEKPFIIPAGYSILTKQKAQDHALPHAKWIGGLKQMTYSDACCIQQTQPGYIDGEEIKEDFSLLPVSIRRNDFRNISTKNTRMDFSRLWPYISEFQKGLVMEGYGNLVLFFNRYMDQLATFSAEFEPVEGQLGAIILINDEIVGIELTPDHNYFYAIWDTMIRNAYGAEVLSRSLKNVIPTFKNKEILDLSSASSIDDLFNLVQSSRKNNDKKMLEKINGIVSIAFQKIATIDEEEFKQIFFKGKDVDSKNLVGEAFLDKGGKLIYLSLLFSTVEKASKDHKNLSQYLT